MLLKNIMQNINYNLVKGNIEVDINQIQYDSRKIKKGDVFFCIKGYKTDGHKFINKALENGASALIVEKKIEVPSNVTVIKVQNSRKALAIASSNFYNNAANKLKIIGITGTNGKTTSSYMIKSILEQSGFKVGLIGTIANYIGNEKIPATRTTPESLELHKLFYDMVNKNVKYCIMEVSSHSLSLDRVYGIKFCEAMFTNLTRDHLDFHKSFENYYNAKLKLFKNSTNSVINFDDKYGKKMCSEISNNIISYGIEGNYDVIGRNINMHSKGLKFEIHYKGMNEIVNINMPGKYNVYNALGSAAVCLNEGISIDNVKKGLGNVTVPGRCEVITNKYNLDFDIIIDYAHTPDGLKNILYTVRQFTKGRLICVFGCGGDRDKTKRPIMGKIGTEMSDLSIITSDNPRTEKPMEIINDIVDGIEKDNYLIIENRREAIKKAMQIGKKGDIIVIAGKGHEDYQILNDKVIHFDEREIVSELIKELF